MTDQPLKTVRVPEPMVPLFRLAEDVVSRYFGQREDRPEMGSIEVFGQRYILVRAASLSVEFFTLVEEMYGPGREGDAEEFSRNILFDLAHAIGKSDARNFHAKMGLEDPIARLSAGPVHFAHTGWAFVDIFPESNPVPGPDYCLVYDHPYSFESEAWVQSGRIRHHPSCIMNAGYSSGWCEESFGLQLVSSEILCRAKGDDCCRFIMAPPSRIEGRVQDYMANSPALAKRMEAHSIPDFFSRKRLEEELKESRAQLERRVEMRTRELVEAGERLKAEMLERRSVEERLRQTDKLEAIGRLTGGIAHDFNNLLTVILGYTNLALDTLSGEEAARPLISEVLKASERAASLTQQLLAFSRQQVLSPKVLDLNAVVQNLATMLRRIIGEHIELELILDPVRPRIIADAGQIEQVLMNLAVNARDAMPAGGRLRLETCGAGDGVRILVKDTGEGMSEATLARIFEPFFTTKERGKGTGLGLATVYGIVSQSRGEILVTSRLGEGSLFEIRLPATQEPLPAEPAALGAPTPVSARTILLVEDEEGVRNLFTEVLAKAGYRILAAADPDAALTIAAGEVSIDLLLTDVVMPGMSGKQLAQKLGDARPGLRVVYMSGYTDHILESETGGWDFIQKPCSLEELHRKVREVLAR
ncbi:MAG: response regulator [Holophagaceae bacterium]|nr:response regulator [Holophagaceae bacterium]